MWIDQGQKNEHILKEQQKAPIRNQNDIYVLRNIACTLVDGP